MGYTHYILTATSLLLLIGCKSNLTSDTQLQAYQSGTSQSGLDVAIRDNLRKLVGSLTDKKHSMEGGAYITTVSSASVGSLIESSSSLTIPVNLNINVSASSSQRIPLGASAGGNLYFNGTAQALIKLHSNGGKADVSLAGISWPKPLKGNARVWTNAKLARATVLRKAQEQANAMIPSSIGKIKRQVESLFSEQMNSSIAQLRPTLRQFFADVEEATGLSPQFWGRDGIAHVSAAIAGPSTSSPKMPSGKDIGVSVNQELLAKVVAKQISGKTQSPDELRLNICKSFKATQMEGCQARSSQKPIKMQMKFPEDPAAFRFSDDRMLLNLTFKIIASTTSDFGIMNSDDWSKIPTVNKSNAPLTVGGSKSDIERDASKKPKLTHITPYATVSVAYNKSTRKFDRDSISVTLEKTEDDNGVPQLLSEFYRGALITGIKKQFADIAPSWLGIPTIPVFLLKPGSSETYLVKDPKNDFGARNGWLYSFYGQCNQSIDALGISVETTPHSKGKNVLRVTSVRNGSPADVAEVVSYGQGYITGEPTADYKPGSGIMKGDIIYLVDKEYTYIRDANVFNTMINTRSTIPDKREVELKIGRYLKLPDMDEGIWIDTDFKVKLNATCGT